MSSNTKITLKSSDGETFEVDTEVTVDSQTIKHIMEYDCAADVIHLPNVTSEYCGKHVAAGADKEKASAAGGSGSGADGEALKDAEFVKVDQNTLFDLKSSDHSQIQGHSQPLRSGSGADKGKTAAAGRSGSGADGEAPKAWDAEAAVITLKSSDHSQVQDHPQLVRSGGEAPKAWDGEVAVITLKSSDHSQPDKEKAAAAGGSGSGAESEARKAWDGEVAVITLKSSDHSQPDKEKAAATGGSGSGAEGEALNARDAEVAVITLKSSDGETFGVDTEVAVQSLIIKFIIEDVGATDVIPVPIVTSNILSKVLEYCSKHDAAGADEEKAAADRGSGSGADGEALKAWDAEFVEVDQNTLFHLILAADYLNIKGLLDLTCHTVGKTLKEIRERLYRVNQWGFLTAEEIRMPFSFANYFTPEEEELYRVNQWGFLTPEEIC